MKRTCNGCRALDTHFCDLGYKVKGKWHKGFLYSETIPAEECPKPRTYEKLLDLIACKEAHNR